MAKTRARGGAAVTRQVVVTSFSGADGLRIVDVPEPHAGPHHVRVRVTAAGLNPVDLRIAEGGSTAARFGAVPPYVNGNDFAGVIDEVGSGVAKWRIGDRVYGGARSRAQSEHLVIDDLGTLMRTPEGVSDREAAVLDIAARTAWAGIEALRLRAGETALVSSAAGGCGWFACQFALRRGARVIGTVGAAGAELVSGLGAVPVDHRGDLRQRIREVAPEGVAAVFDAFGGDYIQLGIDLGVPLSRINSVADRDRARAAGALSIGRAATDPRAVEPLGRMVAAGELKVRIDGVYPVSEVVAAYRRLDAGHVHGKLVLDLASGSRYRSGSQF